MGEIDRKREQDTAESEKLTRMARGLFDQMLGQIHPGGTTGEAGLKLVRRNGLLVDIHIDDHTRIRASGFGG